MKQILIVEDIAETRDWLVDIATIAFPDAQIVACVNIKTAQQALGKQVFDLGLIDVGLPDGSGIDLLRFIQEQQAPTLCVITTMMSDDATVVAALSAGADGYLLKDNPETVLTRQLTQLALGVPALSPTIARRIMEHFRRKGGVTRQL